jgi:acetylornithine deacetylase/succinyl-diaminopimelate desuccinylase-like protein
MSDRPGWRADLERLVRIPSVSAEPGARVHLDESAALVADLVRAAGLPEVDVVSAEGGLPAVIGRRPAPPGAPTVLLYAHHDVQPAGPREEWRTDPFEPVEQDGRLHGRGAADDKAGVVLHCAAVRALGEAPVGITVLVEGEEEIGSPTLPALIAEQHERLAADALVLADSTNWRVGVPALTTSLRGGVAATVEVRALDHAVHQGVYGGPVPDALTALVRLLATLHDERGDVAVQGLARADSEPLDLTEERLRADAGVLPGVQLLGSGALTTRLWTAPAVSVVGLDSPSVDGAAGVLVPSARALVALRTAPGDDPARARQALVDHLEQHAPWGVQVSVSAGSGVAPYRADTSGPAYAAAHAAYAEAWGTEAVEIGVGGSIGFVAMFAEAFPAAEVLITGVEDPDTRAHAANESLHLGDFEKGIRAEELFLRRMAQGQTSSR